jgi:hypothetical protein
MRRSNQACGIDDEDRRAIVVVGCTMVLLTVLGYAALGIVMKMNGYPDQNPFIRFTPLAISLRQYGPWSLAIPLLWAISTFISCYVKRRLLTVVLPWALTILGLLIPALFFYAAFNSHTRPLLMHSPEKSAPATLGDES